MKDKNEVIGFWEKTFPELCFYSKNIISSIKKNIAHKKDCSFWEEQECDCGYFKMISDIGKSLDEKENA
jgi:hypothetical protein